MYIPSYQGITTLVHLSKTNTKYKHRIGDFIKNKKNKFSISMVGSFVFIGEIILQHSIVLTWWADTHLFNLFSFMVKKEIINLKPKKSFYAFICKWLCACIWPSYLRITTLVRLSKTNTQYKHRICDFIKDLKIQIFETYCSKFSYMKVKSFLHFSCILTWWAEPKRRRLNMNKIMKKRPDHVTKYIYINLDGNLPPMNKGQGGKKKNIQMTLD